MTYNVTWLTSQLACGSAPMSYDDLDHIKMRQQARLAAQPQA